MLVSAAAAYCLSDSEAKRSVCHPFQPSTYYNTLLPSAHVNGRRYLKGLEMKDVLYVLESGSFGNPLLGFCKGFLVLVLVSCLCSGLT